MHTQCGRLPEIRENWLNATAFGHTEHCNISNVAPTESYKMSQRNIFLIQPLEHQQAANLSKRYAIAGQHTVKLLLVLNDAHNPINNPTVQIADPRKQNTILLGNYQTNRRTTMMEMYVLIAMTHQFCNMFLLVGSLFCPSYQILPVWFHKFWRRCCFRLTTVLARCHSDTLHNISRPDTSLSGGSLEYLTACDNVKRYCTLPWWW